MYRYKDTSKAISEAGVCSYKDTREKFILEDGGIDTRKFVLEAGGIDTRIQASLF